MSVVNRFMSQLITELQDTCTRTKPTQKLLHELVLITNET